MAAVKEFQATKEMSHILHHENSPFGTNFDIYQVAFISPHEFKTNDMKMLLISGIILTTAVACIPMKENAQSNNQSRAVSIDSTTYELSIADPDFDRWYLMYYSPARERNNEYYHAMNSQGVANWNLYFTRNRYSSVIGSFISYNPSEDYGIEVNRKLYWYFRYIEENFRIRLLQ